MNGLVVLVRPIYHDKTSDPSVNCPFTEPLLYLDQLLHILQQLMLSQWQGLGENVGDIVSRLDIGDFGITTVNELPEPMTFDAEVLGARV